LSGLLHQLAGKDLELAFAYRDAGRFAVDSSQLHQVLLNLVATAREASAKGGRIAVGVDRAYLDEEFIREHAGTAPGRWPW